MFTEAFEDLLRGHCTPARVRAIEAGGSPAALWAAITDAGFLELMSREEDGGAGLDLAAVLPLLRLLGCYAVPLPVGQSIVARTLLPPEELPVGGIITLAPSLVKNADGSFTAARVPHGKQASHVLGEAADEVWLLAANAAECTPDGVHLSPNATLRWSAGTSRSSSARRIAATPAGAVESWGAALHAALLAGALTRTFELTLSYANDRTQFGKSIGKFQAIQQQLAVLAEHVAAASMATQLAFPAEQGDQARQRPAARLPSRLPAAMAKARTSEAAQLMAATAHALHGAIGITAEYDLQLYTRRLHDWRIAHGSESHWHVVVGQAVLAAETSSVAEFVRTLAPA